MPCEHALGGEAQANEVERGACSRQRCYQRFISSVLNLHVGVVVPSDRLALRQFECHPRVHELAEAVEQQAQEPTEAKAAKVPSWLGF